MSLSDNFKTQEMCNKAVEKDPCLLGEVPDHFKPQEMCNKAVEKDPCSLKYVPDCFQLDMQALEGCRCEKAAVMIC